MKHALLLATLGFILQPLLAAVPLRWTVETSRLQPVAFDVVRGETLALEAAFKSYGTDVSTSNKTAFLCWQTNGMDSAWWVTNAVTSGTSASALFTPEMDPGAPVVRAFVGLADTNTTLSSTLYPLSSTLYPLSSLSYRAAFTLRFRSGPGASPNALPLPTPTLDCAAVTFLNPSSAPWSGGGGGVSTNAVDALIASYDATNLTARLSKKLDTEKTVDGTTYYARWNEDHVFFSSQIDAYGGIMITRGDLMFNKYPAVIRSMAGDLTLPAENGTLVTTRGVTNIVASKQDALTFDATPTAGSTNPVTSSGIRSAIAASAYSAGNGLVVESGAIGISQTPPGISGTTLVGGLVMDPTDYSASGFTSSKYATIDAGDFATAANAATTWEIVLKVKYVRNEYGDSRIFYSGLTSLNVTSDRKFCFESYVSGSSVSLTTDTLEENAVYYVKVVKTETLTSLYISTDGSTYSLADSGASLYEMAAGDASYIGKTYGYAGPIYLAESYIKMDGVYWWRPVGSGAQVAKATTSLYGLVKPDGTTVTVSDGVISATAATEIAAHNASAAAHSALFAAKADRLAATYDFNGGTNFTRRLYEVLTNVIATLGGTVTNAPAFTD